MSEGHLEEGSIEDKAKATMKLFPMWWVISCGDLFILGFCGGFQAWALHVATLCIWRGAWIPSASLILFLFLDPLSPILLIVFSTLTALGNLHCFSPRGQGTCLFLCYCVSNATEHTTDCS